MKKITSIAFLLLCFLTSFGEKSIQLRLEKGKTYSQVMNVNSKISQFVQGMSMDVEMGVVSITSYKVLDVKDSLIFTEVTLSNIKTTVKSPMGVQEFSSDSQNASDPSSKLMQEFTKNPFKVTLTKSGRVVEVDANAAIEKAMNSVANLSDEQKKMMKDQFSTQFGDAMIKQSLENTFAYYPPKKVKGEKWNSTLRVKNMIEMEIQNENEVADVTNESVTVKYAGEIASPETTEPTMINGMSAKYAISGTSEGTVTLDAKTGWIITSTINQSLKGNIEILPSAQVPNGMQVPITVNTTGTVTR
jgi:hypothetical protein